MIYEKRLENFILFVTGFFIDQINLLEVYATWQL